MKCFSKMIMSALLTVCITVTAAGCSQSSEADTSSSVSDANSDASAVQSSTSPSVPENTAGNTESEPESTAENKPESVSEIEPESKAEDVENQSSESISQSEPSAVKTDTNHTDNNGNIVVVLDPGHDDKDDRPNEELGVNEQELNLKIGLACYDRLSEYEGITPYLTRYDEVCPNTDGMFTGQSECIHRRAYIAEEKNADFFVSLHCNATTGELGAEANGICVFISNYPKYKDESEKLGNMIIDHVTNAVKLGSMGVILSEMDESKGYYDDGTVKDKYYLLSYNIDYGRPSVIVEHAFMDNINDNTILKDDENLRLMGRADADAIAEYYGLKLKTH